MTNTKLRLFFTNLTLWIHLISTLSATHGAYILQILVQVVKGIPWSQTFFVLLLKKTLRGGNSPELKSGVTTIYFEKTIINNNPTAMNNNPGLYFCLDVLNCLGDDHLIYKCTFHITMLNAKLWHSNNTNILITFFVTLVHVFIGGKKRKKKGETSFHLRRYPISIWYLQLIF